VFRIVEKLFFTTPPDDDGSREGSAGLVFACVVLALCIIGLGLVNERVVALLILPALPGGAP
jgi:hypothetical protein